MRQEEVIEIVKNTAPVLAEEGENITSLFYQKLFLNHPELQNVFNMANQSDGDQARALAQSVFQYASHLDKLEKLGPLVKRIAHKHASLSVTPEQYPIVGKYLLEAIAEHLGLDDTDPIIQAWAVAYGQLAAIFVQTEEQIYTDNENKPGGWRGFRPFIISRIDNEARGVQSFYLKPEDGEAITDYEAGQYLGVKIENGPDEYEKIRQYSLSDAPNEGYYRITVKSEAEHPEHPGVVSNHLHAAEVGSRLFLQPPTGDFTVQNKENDIVLVAGGVGITPLLSMLLTRLQEKKTGEGITFIQCCRDEEHHIMKEQLQTLSQQHGFDYKVAYEFGDEADYQGYIDAAVLERWIQNKQADVYFCGPKPFMSALDQLLEQLGYADDQRYYEVFGPGHVLN